MAISGNFNAGVLSVTGDSLANLATISRNPAGVLLVNGGAVSVTGGTPTVANTTQIQFSGLQGDDVLTLDESNGALPKATISGGNGNDSIIGGSGSDSLFGNDSADTLQGRGGNDFLFGGSGNDVLTGGDGDDQMFGEAGNDRMIWNPGDDSDLMEGGDGIDTAEINGGNGTEVFSLTANGTRVRFDRIDPAPFNLDIGTTENLVVAMNGGNDVFSAVGNLAALITLTVDGGAGNDTIFGGNGSDLLQGDDGNDFIDGNQGNDTVQMGAGNDVVQWDPGDGSDVIDGQGGSDTLLFNGSNVSEIMDVSASGGHVRFLRNVAAINLDINSVEKLSVELLGGSDQITVNNLKATALRDLHINLAGTFGGNVGDGQADTVILNGSNANEHVVVSGSGGQVTVGGLPVDVTITGAEGANDSLIVQSGSGNDSLDASTMLSGNVNLTLDGGGGADVLHGSAGNDILIGGSGNDVIFGEQGNDVAFMGAGNDVFQWDPGDGSDFVDGQDGVDTLVFDGSNANESMDLSANGGHVRLFRDVGNVTMDLDGVEKVTVNATGGVDTIVVNDLTGTDVTTVRLDLAGTFGGITGDGQADSVIVRGTAGDDTISVKGSAASVTIDGIAAAVKVTALDGGLDNLSVDGGFGNDVIDASKLAADAAHLTVFGGIGADLLVGSAGADIFFGGDGNDVALMGKGDDLFVWNPGDDNDIVEGQDGFDELLMNGSNISENINVFANGGRALLTRDVAAVVMDLNDVEKITFNALGGSDTIVVGDMTGTDIQQVVINLAAFAGGAGDGQTDTVIINATNGADVVAVNTDTNGVVHVVGLAAEVQIFGFDSFDRLVINGLAGDDVIDATSMAVSMSLTADGGDGDDVLIAGSGSAILLGGLGDDVLLGGPSFDILDGGPGNNILIQ